MPSHPASGIKSSEICKLDKKVFVFCSGGVLTGRFWMVATGAAFALVRVLKPNKPTVRKFLTMATSFMNNSEIRTEALTWIMAVCAVLGLLLPIFPGTVTKLAQLHVGLRATIGILLILFAILLYWLRRRLTLPDCTRLEVVKSVTIHDEHGRLATVVRTQKERANRNLKLYDFIVNASADGAITEMKIDGQEVNDGERELSCGLWTVRRTKQIFLQCGQTVTTEFSFETADNYTQDVECSTLTIPVRTKRIVLEVNLPPNRPCKDASAHLEYGGQPHSPLPKPSMLNGMRKIVLTQENPKLGGAYCLQWKW